MKSHFILLFLCFIELVACSNQTTKTDVMVATEKVDSSNSLKTTFTFVNKHDSTMKDGESIERYKNGVIKMRGILKNGKREGLWKSWYEDGTLWSETTFKEGIKNGATTTYYPNGKKRYEGFYKDDDESGKWIYWRENGEIQSNKNYGEK